MVWLKLTAEAYPRLSVVRALADDDAAYLGPFSSRRTAELAAAGVYDAVPLRQCTPQALDHAPRRRPARWPSWAGARRPASTRSPRRSTTARAAAPFRDGDLRRPASRWWTRCWPASRCSPTRQRYEEAAVVRSRLVALLRATVRMQRLGALTGIGELVAARRDDDRRLGDRGGPARPAGRRGDLTAPAAPAADARHGSGPPRRRSCPDRARCPAASAEETERILAWLERPDTRLVETSGGWASPARGAARFT